MVPSPIIHDPKNTGCLIALFFGARNMLFNRIFYTSINFPLCEKEYTTVFGGFGFADNCKKRKPFRPLEDGVIPFLQKFER